ncbi:MAG: bacteriohemerythrin [Azospirillum sp.]|nr:bacteriohemerythrin [Azospirillum sp.]
MTANPCREPEYQWDLVTWNDTFRTGNPGIDEDHQKLLQLFNEFSMAVNAGKSESIVQAVLDDLVDYTHYHFSREEALMLENGYPDYERHKKMHDTFARQIIDVGSHLDVGGDMGAFLLSFLAKWLSGHILVADKRLGDYLESRGINVPH